LTLEINRLRAVLLALAMVLSAALIIETAQPVNADAAAKKTKNGKKTKKKRKKKAKKGPRKGPAGLKFYKPPKKLPAAHGKLIWQRKAGGSVPLRSAAVNKLVLYTSKSATGKMVAVSGSIAIPKGKAPKGGWPVITYGHGTTGIADKCAPSRNTKGGVADPYISYTDPEMNEWLKAGYAVARTDYQGLGTPGLHPFLVGVPEGRSVLDIVSASRQLGLKISKKYLIAGHSQGGHAALWAAGLAAGYGKGIKLKGTVAYAPASNFKFMAQALSAYPTPNSLSALATLLVRGMTAVYPEINQNELLSDDFLAFWPDTKSDCLSELAVPSKLGGLAPANMIRPGYDRTRMYEILDAQNPAVKTSAPILLAQGDADSTVPKILTDMLEPKLLENGDKVDYKVYPGATHGGVVATAEPDVMAFFESRLPGGK
jgi:pimeloyl-ACP methyl ester carboxylesterase